MNRVSKIADYSQWRRSILFTSMILMLAGLLFSRFLLSAGLIIMIPVCVIDTNISKHLRFFFSSVFLLSMSALFLLPLVSGLWSANVLQWLQILRIKLPLFLLPVCFAAITGFRFRHWFKLAVAFLVFITAGVAWSLWGYFIHAKSVQNEYLRAHTITTPVGNDHVRFSLLVVIAILTVLYMLVQLRQTRKKKLVGVGVFLIIVFVLYLHILAVRTGLFSFYIGFLIYCTWIFGGRKSKLKYAWLLGVALIFPVLSYFFLPTFKNRVSYVKYDLSFVKKDVFVPGSNDGDRLISLQAGWHLLVQHPFSGVGFGDIQQQSLVFYRAHYPEATTSDRILPSSEWIMYGAGTGWPGIVVFSVIMLVPFFMRAGRRNIFWVLLNIFLALSYVGDIGLEVQYGVFIHAFVLLWWYHWLRLKQ